ncbi:MAG: tripartite tricarboxylate transporter substrate binding protein [Pseudomonadota bacterium]
MLTRRTLVASLAGLTLARPASAQTFPTRTLTIVVPYPAGGPVDVVARLIAPVTGGELGQTITVDNRGGGAGTIGTLAVARADADGHMLVLGTNQTHATNQSLIKNCPYDGVKDFAPVAGLADIPHVLVTKKNLAAADVRELVALAKAQPGKLSYGSTGNGSASHLAAELFKTKSGTDILHIPFRGAAPMTTELLAGRLDLSFATLPSVITQIEAGELRALAVASPKRAARLPNVPTLAEAGVAGVEADAWFALFAPAQTPPAVIDQLHKVVSRTLAQSAVATALATQGMTVSQRSPAEMATWLPGEVAKWAAVIKAANVTVD